MARRLIIRLRMLALKNWMERRRVRSVTRANGGRQRLDAEPHQCWRGTGMHAREHIHIDVTQMVATRPYGIRPTGWTSGAWIEELKGPPMELSSTRTRSLRRGGRASCDDPNRPERIPRLRGHLASKGHRWRLLSKPGVPCTHRLMPFGKLASQPRYLTVFEKQYHASRHRTVRRPS